MRTAAVLAIVWVIAIAAGLLMWTSRQHPPQGCIGIGKGMEARCWN